VNIAWQARMAKLPDMVHDYDYSTDGTEAGLPDAWRLPED